MNINNRFVVFVKEYLLLPGTAAGRFVARVILSACSPYFRAMFTGELAESRATEVTIRDVDEQAMEQLVDFCYTAHIVVEESNVQVLRGTNWRQKSGAERLLISICIRRPVV